MDAVQAIRQFWDEDAATYDDAAEHRAASVAERATWAATLRRHLPAGSSVLGVGAGTGFLSLAAARLGYRVTAVDISDGMLARRRVVQRTSSRNATVTVRPSALISGSAVARSGCSSTSSP
ncbi:MAG: class I SAM-dependent methyltransferase [Pseudonocardiaceae bacterium]